MRAHRDPLSLPGTAGKMMLARRAMAVRSTAALISAGLATGLVYVFTHRSKQREQSRQMITASARGEQTSAAPPPESATPQTTAAPTDDAAAAIIAELPLGRRIAGVLAWSAGLCALGYGAYVAYVITAASRGLGLYADHRGILALGLIVGAIVLTAIGYGLLRISEDMKMIIGLISFVLGLSILIWAIFLFVVSQIHHASEKFPAAVVPDIMIVIGIYLMSLPRTVLRVTRTNDN